MNSGNRGVMGTDWLRWHLMRLGQIRGQIALLCLIRLGGPSTPAPRSAMVLKFSRDAAQAEGETQNA